jgi:hypothetical protein
MKLVKAEYSELKEGDRVLIQNHNGQCGVLIFIAKDKHFVQWETLDEKEVWDDITHLKEKKTKLIGIIK